MSELEPRAGALPHPLVRQLRFTRGEFRRGLRKVPPDDARGRPGGLNAISWSVGHLAWQEQKYFLHWGQGVMPYPEIDRTFRPGAPGTTPDLAEMVAVWTEVTKRADPWLDALTTERLLGPYDMGGQRTGGRRLGDLLQRVIYHYWFHLGMNQAVRKLSGHQPLPQFVGNIDDEAPFAA